jgi:hypothetical protein
VVAPGDWALKRFEVDEGVLALQQLKRSARVSRVVAEAACCGGYEGSYELVTARWLHILDLLKRAKEVRLSHVETGGEDRS